MKRVMFVGAHQDDMEGTATGLFAKLHKHLEYEGLEATLTNGAGGHCAAKYLKDPQKLIDIRHKEATAAADVVDFAYKMLTDVNGNMFPDSDLHINRASKGAVWAAIREFQPDVLVSLPVNDVKDSYGMHNDHTNVGEIVKRIAYLIAAPFAFPEYYSDEYIASFEDEQALPYVEPPIIVTTRDGYSGQIEPDLVIDIGDVIDAKVEAWSRHTSQVQEWLPWVGRYPAPASKDEIKEGLRQRGTKVAEKLGLKPGYYEAFTLTKWGRVPTLDEIKTYFPGDATDYQLAKRKLEQFNA